MTPSNDVCTLALEDGTVFVGVAVGASGTAEGEVVFNTAMSGYQEVLTDPSYRGQIVAMTYPMMGNYGVFDDESESDQLHLSGFIMRDIYEDTSPGQSRELGPFLKSAGIVGLAGIDTRALTRRLRTAGALRGVVSTEEHDPSVLVRQARASAAMTGRSLIADVTGRSGDAFHAERGDLTARRMVVIDCGVKLNILRILKAGGLDVQVVPAATSPAEILAHKPAGVLITNGPGDPAAEVELQGILRALIGRLPLFGICMGCQLLGLALGAQTYKLRFGHHGANHPVLHVPTGRVAITSQNHGFALDEPGLTAAGATVTHRNLFDGSVEGFVHDGYNVAAVQFHPEAAPGPRDALDVFELFYERMTGSPT